MAAAVADHTSGPTSGSSPAWFEGFRRKIVEAIELVGGRHDEEEIYGRAPGDPGLAGGPGSISWEINGDLASLVVGGTAAIIMEILHPSVMHGVSTQSAYREDPVRRARQTLGYVLRTTFGSTAGATRVIESVKSIHGRIRGTRADGVRYAALDPDLIAWVHTCIPWAVMSAFERYNRPLSIEEKDRYLAEQAVVGRMGGADRVPETVGELEDYVRQMRPMLAVNAQTVDFIGFLAGRVDVEKFPPLTRRELSDRWVSINASMLLMPTWARDMTGTHQSRLTEGVLLEPSNRLKARLVRWACPELPCKVMALERARASQPGPSHPSGSRQIRSIRTSPSTPG